MLGGGRAELTQADGKLAIKVPASDRDPVDTVILLELEGSAMDLPAITPSGGVKATASNVYQKMFEEYGPEMAFDSDNETRWATDSGTRQAWIAADLGRQVKVQRVRIAEAAPYAGRVKKFDFQYRQGGEWKTIFTGTTLGEKFQRRFEPVTAREFRLNIQDATEGPTIAEIELVEK